MGSASYVELLKDPRWQRRRLEIMERDGFRCQMCSADDKTLHVHHRVYERGRAPWEASDANLVTLCEDCHQFVTARLEELRALASRADRIDLDVLVGVAKVSSVDIPGGQIDLNYYQAFGAFIRNADIRARLSLNSMRRDPETFVTVELPPSAERLPPAIAALGTEE